jgi:hypothetical protein
VLVEAGPLDHAVDGQEVSDDQPHAGSVASVSLAPLALEL